MPPRLIVEVVGDTSALEKSFARAQKATNGFGRDMERAGRGATVATLGLHGLGRAAISTSAAFLGGFGAVAAFKASSEAASNLSEQLSKSNQVFGDSADSVESWSKTTVNSMGLAQDQALETASSFGALLRPIGLTGQAAADQSRQLTQLGADLASFYNTDVKDALDAIRSGLVGESEPLRRYGVLLSETRVQQEALRQTGKKHATELTNQEKVLARIALIYRDTNQAQGDFQRTSNGLANQQRILQANVRKLEITLGQALNPVLLDIVRNTNKWLSNTKNQEKVQRGLNDLAQAGATSFGALADGILAAADAYGKFKGIGKDLPGGKDGFFSKLITGSLPAQVEDLSNRIHHLGEELGFVKKQSDTAGQSTGTFLTPLQLLLEGAVGQTQRAVEQTAASRFGAPPVGNIVDFTKTFRKASPGQTRDQRTAVALAQAQAAGDRKTITAAANARLEFIRDTVAFAQKLLREHRGNTAQLTQTLQSLFGEESSIDSIFAGFAEDDARKADAAAKKAKAAREKLAQREKKALAAFRAFERERARRAADQLRATNQAAINQLGNLRNLGGRARAFATERNQRQQFLALGLGPTGQELTPTAKALRAQANSLSKAIQGTFLDTSKTNSILSRVRQVLSGNLGKVGQDVRSKVKEILDGIDQDLTTHVKGPATKLHAVSERALTEGLDLDAATRRALRQRIAGQHLLTGSPQNRVVVEVHHTTNIDGKVLERTVTHHQTKAARRKPTQVRGQQTRNSF